MKSLRILLASLLVVAMVLPLCSCSSGLSSLESLSEADKDKKTEETETTEPSLKKHNLYQNSSMIKLLNERTVFSDAGELAVDWGGSGFEFEVEIAEGGSDLSIETRSNYSTDWKVFFDGKVLVERFTISSGKKNTTVATELPEGRHILRFVRESQVTTSGTGYFSVLSVSINATLLPAANEKEMYIEFVGDGLLTGYGVTGSGKGSSKIDEETCATLSLPYLTSKYLDADYSVVARYGIGLGTKAGPLTLPDLYDGQLGYRERETLVYTPTRTPDAVVIHVGMDDSYSALSVGEFCTRAKLFVEQIRSYYGKDVPVVWIYGARMVAYREGEYLALVQMFGEDSNVSVFKMNYGISGSSGNASVDPYPNVEETTENAILVADYLSRLINNKPILDELRAQVEAEKKAEQELLEEFE